MRLLLVRHAAAEPRAEGRPDEERALTREGRARFRRFSLPWLAEHGPFDRLLHSPWRRAAETAAMMKECLDDGADPEPLAALARAPDAALLAHCAGDRVCAVGHQPWLTGLAVLACCGAAAPERSACIALRKGGALLLEGELTPGAMRMLELFAPPRR